jgi:hypothetical protein
MHNEQNNNRYDLKLQKLTITDYMISQLKDWKF